MRFIATLLACAGVALVVAGCDPTVDRKYFREGVGIDLYTADRAQQIELQNQYIDFICQQAGPQCGGNWAVFVQAGMNDIDQRCDGFLTWIDAQRRDKEPVLAELSAINTATHTVMTITGASPKSLDILTAAFGLATATYTNWNSRLLLAVNQSTVQTVVYTSQGQYREKIKSFVVSDRAYAIYLLRNYLRLCMPTTIEASINVTTMLVKNDAPVAAQQDTVVKSVSDNQPVKVRGNFVIDDPGDALVKFVFPNGVLAAPNADNAKEVTTYMSQKKIGVSLMSFLRSATYTKQRADLFNQLRASGKL